MRLDTAREETISTIGGAQKFKMNASAKAFQILSSGIYERKIEAIVRELSCNAYDSHVMAGKAEVPFRIQLPTWKNDNVFAIEDFGVGLSEEEVYNVYTTYFESTKTDSNDVIGALGLGSKTPFSYTDSFTVKARKNGKECVFSAQISAAGEPEVIKMYERPWTGENGVEVSVEVADKDVNEFFQCAEKVLSWFEVKPECNRSLSYDFDSEIIENVRKYGYHLKQKEGWYNVNCKAVMGNVAYDLELDDLVKNSQSHADDVFFEEEDYRENVNKFISVLKNIRADLFFTIAIGEADVAASRETLSLDDRTKYNLRQRLYTIYKNFRETTVKKIENMSSIFEVANKLTPYERSLVRDFKVNGYCLNDLGERRERIRTSVRLPEGDQVDPEIKRLYEISEDFEITIYGSFNARWGARSRSKRGTEAHYSDLLKDNKIQVVVNDCERKSGIKDAIMDNDTLGRYIMVVTNKNTTLTKDLEDLLNYLTFNSFNVIYASSFWDGKLSKNKSKSTGLAKQIVKSKVIRPHRSYPVAETVDFSELDKSKWAYVNATSGHITLEFEVNGDKRAVGYITTTHIVEVCKELDLEGIVLGNGNNIKKIERILQEDRKLDKLIQEKACKTSAYRATLTETVKDLEDQRFEIFDRYNQMLASVKAVDVPYKCCSQLVYGFSLSYSERKKIEESIKNRMKVFERSVNILREKSILLSELLKMKSWRFDYKMLPEIKEYIELKNWRV